MLAAVALVAVTVTSLSLFHPAANSSFSPFMSSEGMGRRQYDYLYFGFIPYSRVEEVPNLHTEDDLRKQFEDAGLAFAPGYGPTDKGARFMRSFHASGESSTLYFMDVKDPSSLFGYFRAQGTAPHTNAINADGTWEVEWQTMSGESVRVSLMHSYDPKTHKPTGNMLHMHVSPAPRAAVVPPP